MQRRRAAGGLFRASLFDGGPARMHRHRGREEGETIRESSNRETHKLAQVRTAQILPLTVRWWEEI